MVFTRSKTANTAEKKRGTSARKQAKKSRSLAAPTPATQQRQQRRENALRGFAFEADVLNTLLAAGIKASPHKRKR